jgi:Phage tail lysozyme
LTAGSRRTGSSKFGLFRRAAPAQSSGPADQSQDGRDVAGYYQGDAGDPALAPELRQKAERYTGRHASPRGKAARKSRVGKVVPAVAVAAAVAAGTAAYSLTSGGQPQAAQFNASVTLPSKTVAPVTDAGQVNGAGSSLIAQATAREPSHAAAAKTTPSHTPAAPPSASSTPAKPATPTPSAATTTQAATPSATATSKPATAATLSCNLNYSMLPQNVTAIVSFLVANGYSHNAAAGIAGNIYQESKGDPESVGMGGGGLIGWTPLPSGMVTGNKAADLQTQLKALLTYNQIWSSYIPALNAASSPASAAYIYVTDFERAGIPAAATREASARNVASACGL